MYAKLFSRITESSLMEEPMAVRYVFMMLLAIADQAGDVIGTDVAIARRINVPVAEFQGCVDALMQPDPDSNSQEQEGRRIVNSEGSRGYHLVNYLLYRGLKTAEDRREYMRKYMGERRRKQGVKPRKQVLAKLTHAEAEGKADEIQSSADPRFASVTAGFAEAYKREFGEDYAHKGGRDGNALKKFLKGIKQEITAEQIVTVIGKAMAHRKTTYAVACKRATTIHGFCDGYNEIRAELKAASESNGNGSAPHRNGHEAPKVNGHNIREGIDPELFRSWLFDTYPRAKSDLNLTTVPVQMITEYRKHIGK